MIFEAIFQQVQSGSTLTVEELCSLANVSRSGYYRWINAAPQRAEREQKDYEDFLLIKAAFLYRGYDKGYRGITIRLARTGIKMNAKKVRRLMRKYGLWCPVREANPYRRMAKNLKTSNIAPNTLSRAFRNRGPRRNLLTDITYLRLNDGFVYLSVIKDAYTMEVLAYKLSDSLEVDFVLDTVRQLIKDHGDELYEDTLIHSDQGCHYTSIAYRDLLSNENLCQSMSRRGNCWDNAPQESFFGHMKDELKKYIKDWKNIEDVQARIDDWMDYYNNERYQTQLKSLAPTEYYRYCTTGKLPTEMAD